MNIVYVSQYFPPEACAPAIRVDDFGRAWARAGHGVHVLTGFPNHPEGKVHPEFRRLWRRGFIREQRDGMTVHRTWLFPAANRGFWGRSANYLSFAFSASLAGPWVVPRDSVLIASSPQLLVGAAGHFIARTRRLPSVFEVRDLWPESMEAVGAARQDSLIYRGLQRLANFLYHRAERVVVVGEWQRRALVEMGVPERKITVIMNGVDDEFSVRAEDGERLRHEMGLAGCFLVTYCGTLGMAHSIDTVLAAAERLREMGDVVFLLIGEGAERERLERRARELRLGNVRFLGKQPRDRIPAFLAATDACLVPLRRSEVFKTAIPSKMFEAMAAAKPVLLGVEGEAKQILLDARAGIAVPPEDAASLADAVLQLRGNPELGRQLGLSGQRAVREKYSRRQQAAAYLDLLSELKGTRTSAGEPLHASA